MSNQLLNAQQWQEVLMKCGVSSPVAQRWSSVFADAIKTDTFSLGAKAELPDFLGQILHESAMLTRTEENLNYTAKRMTEVWPTRFPTIASAQPFVGNPKALANKVYGNRLGNINGDGWTYRGGGLIMATGLDNYADLQRVTGLPLVAKPWLLREPATALLTAILWWERKVPDCVMNNCVRVRQAVNGGDIGLKDTIKLSTLAKGAINGVLK